MRVCPDPLQNIMGNYGKYQMCINCFLFFAILIKFFVESTETQFLIPVFSSYVCVGSQEPDTCPCSDPIFDKDFFSDTPIMKWKLICEKEHLLDVMEYVTIGKYPGYVLIGIISDRFGRKYGLLTSIMLVIISSFGMALTNNVWVFMILRVTLSIATGGMIEVVYALQIEITGYEPRFYVSIMIAFTSMLGTLILGIFGIEARSFASFLLVVAIPTPLLITIFIILMESPRWQILARKTTDAMLTLEEIAVFNNRTRAGIIAKVNEYRMKLDDYPINDTSFKNIMTTLFSRYILKISAINGLWTFTNSLLSASLRKAETSAIFKAYGPETFNQRTVLLKVLTYTFSCYFPIPFMQLSRRTSAILFGIVAPVFFAMTYIFPESSTYYAFLQCLSVCASIIQRHYTYVYITEVTPTSIRTIMLAVQITMAELSKAFYVDIIVKINNGVEICNYVIIVLGIVSGCVLMFLPEPKRHGVISTLGEENVFKEPIERLRPRRSFVMS